MPIFAHAQTFDWQGHRGARGIKPETTLASFATALDWGMQTLEMDVVISGDGQVVVSHEAWMNPAICSTPDGQPIPPAAGQRYNLHQMTYAEIRRFDCGKRGHPQFPEQHPELAYKPLLTDVIRFAERYASDRGRAAPRYNIEIKTETNGDGLFQPKPDVFASAVLKVVRELGVETRTTLQSFDMRILRALHRLHPKTELALLTANPFGYLINRIRLGFKPHTLSPYHGLLHRITVWMAHWRGVKVIPWTVNDPEQMRHLIRMGVDGIITDFPNRAANVRDAENPQ